jgi:hypothetical protein
MDARAVTVDELVAAGWPREGAEEYVAEEPLNRQVRQWAAQREARRAIDPKYDRYCLEREAQDLEERARASEETAEQMERGEFEFPALFMGEADIANMRYWANENRRWARERRLTLARAVISVGPKGNGPRPSPVAQTSRPRERRPRRRSSVRSRSGSRGDPHLADDDPEPLGGLAPALRRGLDGLQFFQQHHRRSVRGCA